MFYATVFAGNPAGTAFGFAADDLSGIAGAGKKIQRPVGTGLSLELRKVADADPGLHMIGKETAGRIADADIVSDAANARIDIGMAVRIDSVWVDPA